MSERTRIAVAYDITEDRLRAQVRSLCRRYGAHRQYSLFELRMTETEKTEFIAELRDVVSRSEEPAEVCLYSVGPPDADVVIPEGNVDDEPANIA